MSKRQVLMVIGLVIVVVTFLGLPWSVKQIVIVAGGALVVVIVYSMTPTGTVGKTIDVPFSEYKSGTNITNSNSTDQK